jgi:hypothetical protein
MEGRRNVLWHIFQKIQKDDRNYDISLIEFVICEQRKFAGWSVGGCLRAVITDHIFFGTASLGQSRPAKWIRKI